jgi:hypothetical protein
MHAHKVIVTVPESHEVTVKLPSDFPTGEVEIIVLSHRGRKEPVAASPGAGKVSEAFARRYPLAGTFGPVVFREDPVAPLEPEDWGEDLG